jgi:transposase InsO family protein
MSSPHAPAPPLEVPHTAEAAFTPVAGAAQPVDSSDRGAQLTSSLWAALCQLLNISHSTTTAYHPQSNGLVERFQRRLTDALQAWSTAADWVDHLPWVMLGIRAAIRKDSDFTPAEAVLVHS